jgi:hypothetical protein
MVENKQQQEIRKEAERVLESAMYTSQTQFEYSKTWRSVDRWVGGSAAALASVSAAGGLSEVFSARWAGLIALAAALVGAIATTLGAPKAKDRAHSTANALLALQQDARMFLNIDIDGMSVDDARDELKTLVARQQELNATAEIPSGRAWKRAKSNVERGTQAYETDSKEGLDA